MRSTAAPEGLSNTGSPRVSALSSGALSRQQRAARLADEHYEPLKDEVLAAVGGKLWGRKVQLDLVDLEAAYSAAWTRLWAAIRRGEEIESTMAFLVKVSYLGALDIHRQRRESLQASEVIDEKAGPVDLVELADDRLRLQTLFARLARKLNAKERKGVVLCLLQGHSRAEAARMLGIREPAFQKIMDRAMRKIDGVVAGIDSRGCDPEWAQAVRAFAESDDADDEGAHGRLAAHLQDCPSCKRYATALRGLAVFPPPLGLIFEEIAGHPGGALRRAARAFKAKRRVLRASVRAKGALTSANGGGIAGLSGVGVAKTIVLLAAALATAAVSVHALSGHPARRQPAAAATRAAAAAHAAAPSHSTSSSRSRRRHASVAKARHSAPRSAPARSQHHLERTGAGAQAARYAGRQSEFGIERAPSSSSESPAPVTQASSPPQPSSSVSQSEAAHSEFGIEGR